MSAIEDPDTSSELVGPDRTSDDLENWLSDLRTEVSADPSGWIDKSAGQEAPGRPDPELRSASREAPARPDPEPSEDSVGKQPTGQPFKRNPLAPGSRDMDAAAKPSGGGRHRAPD